uniref:Protein kinase domain-containing protein n=1 Tax=Fundulus heteroclitus TaxID=8078 RepID=A0A3Q2PPW9_FUNHE
PPGGSPQGKRPSQTVEDKAQTQTPTNTVTPIPRATVGPLPSTPTSKPRPGPLSPVAPTLATPAFGKDALPPPPPSPGQKTGSGFWSSMPASPASRPGSFTFPAEAVEAPVRQTATGTGNQLFLVLRGRFSVVKRCDHLCNKRMTVAVKHVNKKLMKRDQVTQELNLLQRLQHPHIVRLVDNHLSWLTVIFHFRADQGRLLDYIVSWGNLTEEKVASYLRSVLEALHYLHNCRIVHLDVKPENLLVAQNASGQPVVKLTDFGDAVQLNSAHYVHPLLGSPEFASPELVLGEPVSLASDLWSLGVVTYVLLSGASPFLDESAEETCLNICRLDFSFPDDYFHGVSQAAKDFVRQLLRTEPHKRRSAGHHLQDPWIQTHHKWSPDHL